MLKKETLLGNLNLPKGIKFLSYEELDELACEVRELILSVVSKNGGHLASSLGVVELTLALLRLTNPDHDRILWDVSHQIYPYKILTDRLSRFDTLRLFGGISGFAKPEESRYDAFAAGHASTSISAGLGIACADELLGIKRKVVSIIGDASISSGLAFEGINHLGSLRKSMVVVLNDNEMSIGHNVGALSATLSRMLTGETSITIRKDIRKFLNSITANRLSKLARKFEEGAISFFTKGILFEELGLRYIGPIDGHKIKEVEKALSAAFEYGAPALVHIATVKGKGYEPARANPERYHGIASFNIKTGEPVKFADKKALTWTEAAGRKLVELAEKDKKVVAITAAMTDGTGLSEFAARFPDRFFDVGIAEEHAVTFAAGLARAGLKPFFVVYSSFLQRAFDQLIHDAALQNLPVRFCIDRAGLVGQDGPTHHGVFDISYLRLIPEMAIMLPRSAGELSLMLELAKDYPGPVAVRYGRGVADNAETAPLVLGEPEVVKPAPSKQDWAVKSECGTLGDTSPKTNFSPAPSKQDWAVVSTGHIFGEAEKYHKLLESNGIEASLINLRFLRPLNREALLKTLEGKRFVVSFEENVRGGGVGEMLAALLNGSGTQVHIAAIPDRFIPHGTVGELRTLCRITAETVYEDTAALQGKSPL